MRVAFPGESQLQQSHVTQPMAHGWCFSISIIHRTLTWTTGSLTCIQVLMHVIAHKGVQTPQKKSALKVDSGEKIIPCRTRESSLRQWRDGLTLYQLSYMSTDAWKEWKLGQAMIQLLWQRWKYSRPVATLWRIQVYGEPRCLVGRALHSRLKGCVFEYLQKQWDNFLLQS